MRVDAFDFELPAERIALRPAEPRDAARLLVVDPNAPEGLSGHVFADLPDLLRPGDLLVFNDTKVIAARLSGRRTGRGDTAPRIEVTLHRRLDAARWWCFAKPARKLMPGDVVTFAGEGDVCLAGTLNARIEDKRDGGELLLAFELSGPVLDQAIAVHGVMPLPPYIASRRAPDLRDADDYQTV
ncbi:MAG: S-adenosylmethionine:tRNA ribosyltransferase-isomerase, partial [Hyphomicrobiales bacterium]